MDKLQDKILFLRKNPIRFVTDIIGAIPDDHQAEILKSVAENSRTTIRSGHGVGKSTVLSWAILWFITCFPNPKIPCTAPTEHQLKDILWSELAKWIMQSPLRSDIIWTAEKIYMRGRQATWYAVARTAAKPDALQGFHGKNILFVIDEASGVKDALFEPVLGALTTEGAKLLMAGNPTRISGFFADSHSSQRHLYNAIKIDGRNSSRVTQESIQLIIDMFGEDSDVFRVRVSGDFPKAMPDSFIPIDLIEKCAIPKSRFPAFVPTYRLDIGVDVARYGDDTTVIYGVADRRLGKSLRKINKNDTMEVTGAVVEQLRFFNTNYKQITPEVKIDCDGLGVGVYDRLKEKLRQGEIRCILHECHFGSKGGKLRISDPFEFANSTGLMWGIVRDMLYRGLLMLEDDKDLSAQLTNRKYRVNSDGKLELERKEEMKKRGVKSPDIGDALALALSGGKQRATAGVLEII